VVANEVILYYLVLILNMNQHKVMSKLIKNFKFIKFT